MSFNVPEDPFTRDLGLAIQGVGRDFGSAITERRKKNEDRERNKQFAISLGYTQEEAEQFADLSPQEIAVSAKQKTERNQLDNYADFLIESLDIQSGSPKEEAFRNAADLKTLTAMGGFESKKQKDASPFQKSKERRLKKQDIGNQYQRLIKDIKDNIKDYTLLDSEAARKAANELRQEEHKNYKNLEKGKPLETKAIEKYFKLFEEKEEKASPGIFDRIGSFFSRKDSQTQEQFPTQREGQVTAEVQEKITFDKSNPEHTKIRDDILVKVKGNKKEANKLLAEIFKK